jgi:hypothetical protein
MQHTVQPLPALALKHFGWDNNVVPIDQRDFYMNHGFYITYRSHHLRGEVIESYDSAYLITGDGKVSLDKYPGH